MDDNRTFSVSIETSHSEISSFLAD